MNNIIEVTVLNILDQIQNPSDVKQLSADQLPQLCHEIRSFLVNSVSQTGGHLASNLGVVELTVALHRVYDTSRDRLLFDVGHQSYVHKILTGRKDAFHTLRQYGGIAGFPKPSESEHDAFIAGHASTAISTALGMARARTLLHEDYNVVALIGDGALTGGLAYEGLQDAGQSGEPLVIILNDNGMSIHENVGGMASLLSKQRVKPGYLRFKQFYRQTIGKVKPLYNAIHTVKENVKETVLPDNMFDDMGFYYIGPVDGHDIPELERMLRWARDLRQPVILHVVTQKGRGIPYTEAAPEKYHGVGTFNPETGELPPKKADFSKVFGDTMLELAAEQPKLVGITAAMASGTGLEAFAARYPKRFFDVGIAEGHAVTMASAMAKQGLSPVFAVYSSFLQRGYDMLLHDTAIQNLHVVFAVDRAGIVGNDGDTHNGVFDVGYLGSVPGMTIYTPASFAELRYFLRKAVMEERGPVAIRYPRGGEGSYQSLHTEAAALLQSGNDITLVTYGILTNEALEAAEMLRSDGIQVDLFKMGQILPVESAPILESLRKTRKLLVVEEVCSIGSLGRRLLYEAESAGICLEAYRLLDLGEGRVPHGDTRILWEQFELDASSLARIAKELCSHSEAVT
jgi:1-deoxy-D-xylulose-5-phosphate synthase